jgi:glycosyltransferase involved in cell wall biosynthesis
MCGAKHVLNVSDLWPLSAYKLGAISQGYLYRRLQALEHYLYKTAYACTGQSQGIIDHLIANGAKRTNLYRNGVDVTRFNKVSLSSRDGKLRIIYTGLLGLAQGILAVCRNIDFVSLNVEFHIYGDGPEKETIAAYLLQKPNTNIFLNSFVGREEIPPLLARFDLTLIPLIKPIHGAVPSKMYEAMAAGLPILFAGGGEGEQMVKQYDLGWTSPPGNYDEMYHCIKVISQLDRKQLQVFETNCRSAAENVFNREQQLEQLHRFLTQGNNA